MVNRILLVEDDRTFGKLVAEALTVEGHQVTCSSSGDEAASLLRVDQYDLLLLDWEVPGISGVELCRLYRSRGGHAPVLFMTGKGSMSNKEEGFESGADDYLTKPFEIRELTLRVNALLRRPAQIATGLVTCGSLKLNARTHEVLVHEKAMNLSPKEFSLLEFLMKHPNEVFSAEVLITRIWGYDSDLQTESLKTYIKQLRQKLEEAGSDVVLKNIYGIGYKLIPSQ